ncbi:MAG TPA: phosphatase PAP2 family protein [Pyrinomonadaceae bacterium]|nr:phosphatase PAP2 family protein [Pyrinomonadaceae bacterium]
MTEKDYKQPAAAQSPTRDPQRRRVVRLLLRAEVRYLTAMALFAALALFAHFNTYFDWDLAISKGLQHLKSPVMFTFMRAVSLFGDKWIPWVIAGVTIILFLVSGNRSEAAGLLLSTGGGQFLNSLLKRLIARPRPSSDLVDVFRSLTTQSFPSGHVTFYVCYFGFLFFVAYALLPRSTVSRRVALTLTALPVLLIGFSRVYLGEHWPSDTIGAYLSSGLWLSFSLHMYRRWKARATFHAGAGAREDLESASR